MIELSNISLQFNGKYLFRDVNFRINSGDRISLVGANGTGKTSILKIIAGELPPEKGKLLKQKRISIGYLPQDNVTHKGKTLLEEANSAMTDIVLLQQKEKSLTAELADENLPDDEREDLINQLGEVHHRLEELDSYSVGSRVEKILTGLGFEEQDFNRLTDEFSGGWQMRIALSKILISQNDILLLDEPTNHLDIDSLTWLIGFLKNYHGALLIVSHDRHFVDQVTNRTLEIYLARFNMFNGNFAAYLKYKEERDEQAYHLYEHQQKKIRQTERFIERFRYKNTKAKQVQSRIKHLEKLELVELPEFQSEINIRFPDPPPSGRINIELKNITKSYGNNVVIRNLDFKVDRGEKIAFLGPNGTGKSTLAKIIAGVLPFDSGERIIGHNSFISYYAQDVADSLDPDLEIIETVDGISPDKTIGQLRSLLGSFLFHGDDVFKKVGVLSGGEKSRVALAKILLTKSNFIILDEPTNHLDIDSKAVLQQALINFTGSLILVSHDIDFLRPVINKVVEIRKHSVKEFPGGIDYYLSKREQALSEKKTDTDKKQTAQPAISRKEQKRADAELRQKKFQATKDIVKGIEKLESEIEKLEKREKDLELLLSYPSAFESSEKLKDNSVEFAQIKSALEKHIEEWEKLSSELTVIESRFS